VKRPRCSHCSFGLISLLSAKILDREEFKARKGQSQVPASPIGQTSSDLLRPCIRLLDLLDALADIPFFSGLIYRELVYRILQCPQGDRLRAIARLDNLGRGTAKALAWLRANYTKPFRLEELAAIARMGVSTLNHHFRTTTSLSPLQYHKQLRLMGAREKMLVEGWMPQGPLSTSDMRALVSSLANTNASSVNRRCAMSSPSVSRVLDLLAPKHRAHLRSHGLI
jgi:AraC-like DNA-binding protein